MRTIKLHETEYEALLLALAYATGVAVEREKDRSLAEMFIWVADGVNRDNPDWRIYGLSEGLKPDEVIRQFMASLEKKG